MPDEGHRKLLWTMFTFRGIPRLMISKDTLPLNVKRLRPSNELKHWLGIFYLYLLIVVFRRLLAEWGKNSYSIFEIVL